MYTETERLAFRFDTPMVYGNLTFPEDVDFAFPRVTRSAGGDAFEMRRNFLVETAEYVTTNLTQYAQVVILQKPVRLEKVGLALHNFGGEGSLWVDVFADRDGKPGQMRRQLHVIKRMRRRGKEPGRKAGALPPLQVLPAVK